MGPVSRYLLAALALICTSATPAFANVADAFNWQSEWGAIDLNSASDPAIPSSQHGVKSDIENAVALCRSTRSNGQIVPLDGDYSKIRTFNVDFDRDGRTDVVLDASNYFNGVAQTNTCPMRLCTDDGCILDIYRNTANTQILTQAPLGSMPCPVSARDNRECLSYCSATVEQCPGLFVHQRLVEWEGRAFSWQFISAGDYNREISSRTMSQSARILYRQPLNSNPIARMVRADAFCTNEERDVNGDGRVSAGENCVKYLQFVSENGGYFVDLYAPTRSIPGDENMTLWIKSPLHGNSAPMFFNRDAGIRNSAAHFRGTQMGDGYGIKLEQNTAVSMQLPNYNDSSGGGGFSFVEFFNRSNKDIFVPSNTDPEYSSFLRAVNADKVPNVTARPGTYQFTRWVGETSCANVNPACDQVITIAADRYCQRSTSAYADCSECSRIDDPQTIRGWPRNTCFFTTQCSGPPCPPPTSGDGGGGGGDCLTADVKIKMADGTEKHIAMIKPGDMVLAFSNKDLKAPLKPAKVKTTTITGEMATFELNDLKITAAHKVVLEDGKLMPARSVKIGDKILKEDGTVITVTKITETKTPQSVFNMDVEDADGYIAGGLRVEDFPAPEVINNSLEQ